MAEPAPTAKNLSVLMRSLSAQPRQTWLWLAPYVAIGVFALAMLIITGLLQWRELDTAKSALEGDMHWAERTIENRLQAHQDFLGELGRDQEFKQLTYEAFQVRAGRYIREAPEIIAIAWVDIDGKVEWGAPNEATVTFVGDQLAGSRLTTLQEALRIRRTVVSQDYRDSTLGVMHDIIFPVQRGRADIGAFIAIQSLETMLRATLPTAFTARYSLTVVAAITLIQLRKHAQHRAETEEKLRAAYAFRQAMSNSLITGLRAVDLEGRITFVNAAFCRMTGFSESELVGLKPPYPYWPPEEFDQRQHNSDTALAGRAPAAGFEMRIMRKNGERFDVRLYFSPLIDTNGQQIGWMASMND